MPESGSSPFHPSNVVFGGVTADGSEMAFILVGKCRPREDFEMQKTEKQQPKKPTGRFQPIGFRSTVNWTPLEWSAPLDQAVSRLNALATSLTFPSGSEMISQVQVDSLKPLESKWAAAKKMNQMQVCRAAVGEWEERVSGFVKANREKLRAAAAATPATAHVPAVVAATATGAESASAAVDEIFDI